ncbi:MAG: hypothetical protein PVJ80_11495 [Gemmatimonadota bacterium]|jgi:hypothetical protein
MYAFARASVSVAAAVAILLVPAEVQAQSSGTRCSSTSAVDGEWYADRLRDLLSDPAFEQARKAEGLVTLSSTAPSSVWVTDPATCRELRRVAVGEINVLHGTSGSWQNTPFSTVSIGPYVVFVPSGGQGELTEVPIFMASDLSFVTLVVTAM